MSKNLPWEKSKKVERKKTRKGGKAIKDWCDVEGGAKMVQDKEEKCLKLRSYRFRHVKQE